MPVFDPSFELLGRHSGVARTEPVAGWIRRGELRAWSESSLLPGGGRIVTCEPRTADTLFVIHVLPGAEGQPEQLGKGRLERLRGANRKAAAMAVVRKQNPGLHRLLGAVARYEEWPDECPTWRVRFVDEHLKIRWDDVRAAIVIPPAPEPDCVGQKSVSVVAPPGCTPATPEPALAALDLYLRSDELHHVTEFTGTANRWGGPSVTPATIANQILRKVNESFAYEVSDVAIGSLTFADHAACLCLQQRGKCDELAVFMTTLLRARGIPAREVLVTGEYNLHVVAHACVEWFDGSRWVHADPTWSGLGAPVEDDPTVYRATGLEFACVNRPGVPTDAASNLPSGNTPDPDGDDAINPLCDWQLASPLAGHAETDYSESATSSCAAMSFPACGRQ